MCLAIYKPKGIRIAHRYLKHGFENNSDGAGFAICENGKTKIYKGFYTYKEFAGAFEPHADKMAMIHFRIATHGDKTEKNCHPFSLFDDEFALIHNGILNIATNVQKDMSDTWHFATLVLQPMLTKFSFNHPALKYLVETSIGIGNKMVMIRGDGSHVIFNEKHGQWHKGAWYSNDTFKHGKIVTTGWTMVRDGAEKAMAAFGHSYEGYDSEDYIPSTRLHELSDQEFKAAIKEADEEADGGMKHLRCNMSESELAASIAEADDEAEWEFECEQETRRRCKSDTEYKRAEALLMREHRGDNLSVEEIELLDRIFPSEGDDEEEKEYDTRK